MQTVNIVKTIQKKITATTNTGVIELFDNTLDFYDNALSKSAFVKNLKAFSKIQSLEPVRLPNFKLEDSESEKLYKTLDVEFNSPRKQLDLFIGSTGEWSQIGSISLLNPSGYPYRMYNLLDFLTDGLAAELGDGKTIGVEVVDVGFGILQNTDTITIHGSVTQEYVIPEKKNELTCSAISVIVTDTSQIVVPNNSNRSYVLLQNKSNNSVTINLNSIDITHLNGIVLEPNGYIEFSTKDIFYYGDIRAVSNSGESSLLVGTECNYAI